MSKQEMDWRSAILLIHRWPLTFHNTRLQMHLKQQSRAIFPVYNKCFVGKL